MTSVKHISWQGGNTMDFKNFAKDAIGNVKDNAVSKIDANKKKNDLAKQKKLDYDNEQKYLKSIFKATTAVGDVEIDEVNHLLKINNAEANIKKNSKMKSLGKGVLAMYTLGASLAIEHAMKPTGTIFKFNEISDYELLENDTTVASGGLGRAVVGGSFLGGAGAIVGGITGKKKTKKIIDMLVLQISTTNIFFPNLMITYINKKIKNTDKKYISIINDIQKTISGLNYAIKKTEPYTIPNNHEPEEINNSCNLRDDPYEEIKKAKELLDLGIITHEEFEQKKKELLNL